MSLPLDLLKLLPDTFKDTIRDTAVDFVSEQAKKFANEEMGRFLKKLRSDAAFNKQFEMGLARALQRFVAEYELEDEDLVAALAADPTFFQNEAVQKALLAILKKPGAFLETERETLAQSFETVLPNRRNRERVDKAVTFLLQCLAEELWHLPELQPVYSFQFQRVTAEAARTQVELLKAQLLTLTDMNSGLRDALLKLTDAIGAQKQLPTGGNLALPELPPRPKVYHNLPQPDYGRFIGREPELAQVYRILRPYPHSQHALVTIDGIGGIGKSALALEVAHRYLHAYDRIPAEERFDAIIWTSAKQTTLTAEGIVTRPQALRTLDDIYTTIAIALQREDITRARPDEQAEVVRNVLTRQRTLLIVDNLETVDDENVLTFLRELPAPTKAIVTTRHRIDVAYPVRLTGMPWEDAQKLIAQECQKKNVSLKKGETRKLFDRTGGVPLALVWSIAQMGFGYGVEGVLRQLSEPSGDVARFCFEQALQLISQKPAHKILLALSLFASDASRSVLGYVTETPELERDDGLAELEKLSLIHKKGERFWLLPLTKTFVQAELKKHMDLNQSFVSKWIEYYKKYFDKGKEYHWRFRGDEYYAEGENIRAALEWAYDIGTSEDVFALTTLLDGYLGFIGSLNDIILLARRAMELALTTQNYLFAGRFAHMVGWVLTERGEFSPSEKILVDGLNYYELSNSLEGQVVILQRLMDTMRKQRKFEKAQEYYLKALELTQIVSDEDLTSIVKHAYGKLVRDQGQWDLAWTIFSELREWFENRVRETPRDEELARSILGHLGFVAYHLGRPEVAISFINQNILYYVHYGNKGYLATLNYRLALAEESLGKIQAAIIHVTVALDWFDRLGMKPDYEEAIPLYQRLTGQSPQN